MIGETIGHYRIVRKLGEGGMGAVYLADDTQLDRQVALKFLPARVAGDADALERFRREAKAAAALDHPNIVTIHEIGEHDGKAYIAMSYVRGEPLSITIGRKAMTVERALRITLQICDGLDSAHRAGVVHRDIKPDNISIDADDRVRILDFGLAKLGDVTRITQEDSTVGTLCYMSPEQARGEEVDGRTDLFSVGAILYEMLTGRRAFDGEHAAAVHYAIANEDPQPVARFNNDVAPGLERLVSKLLAKDPATRYQSAADVMADIRTMLATSDSGPVVSAAAAPSRRPLVWIGIAAIAVVIAAIALWRPFGSGDATDGDSRPMIVVLPFENLGGSGEEYFADGITEEITSRLATITGLGVISRTSAMRYKGSGKSITEIAEELGVSHVLEGTIRWDRSQQPEVVRITPQLIRTSDDTHVWADNYERTLNRIFEVQADIAAHIADAMEVTLLDQDRSTIATVHTENSEAYTYYLRGLELSQGTATTTGFVQPAIEAFERAVELDPGFGLAWAALSVAHSSYYHNGIDRSPRRLELAKEAAERALELAPEAAETRRAMALYYYWGLKDYDTAIEWAERAAAIRSGDAEIIQLFGFILRRLGRFEEALERMQASETLAPGDASLLLAIAECHMILGDLDAAESYCRRVVTLIPDDPVSYFYLGMVMLVRGDLEAERDVLSAYPGDDRTFFLYAWHHHYYVAREYDRAIESVIQSGLEEEISEANLYPRTLLTGLARYHQGDSEGARADLESAYETLTEIAKERPDDHRLYSSMGLALAALGQPDAAVAAGRKSVAMYPVSKDHYGGPWRLVEMTRIYSLAGYKDEALAQLDELLTVGCWVNTNWARLHPDLDPIRDDPRFDKILRKHEPTS